MNAADRKKMLEGEFAVPPPPRLLIADIQVAYKGETVVEVYQQLDVFKCRAGSLHEAVRFVAVKTEEAGLSNITIVQPLAPDYAAIEMLRRHGLRVNGR